MDLTRIDDGPVATVYSGYRAGVPVAVKVFPKRFDKRTTSAFTKEQSKLSTVRRITSILMVDGVEEMPSGESALRMELCVQSLAGLVERVGPLSAPDVAILGRAMAVALAAAHNVGVVHGGVSPSNVLFRENHEPVLADFGVTLRQAFTRDPLHAIEYLPPETLRTGTLNELTDLYGLGAVLHFALTARSPHPGRLGEQPGERVLRILGEPIPAVNRQDVPVGLSTLVARLLATTPERRPQDAAQVADHLTAMLPNPPTSPPTEDWDDFDQPLPPPPVRDDPLDFDDFAPSPGWRTPPAPAAPWGRSTSRPRSVVPSPPAASRPSASPPVAPLSPAAPSAPAPRSDRPRQRPTPPTRQPQPPPPTAPAAAWPPPGPLTEGASNTHPEVRASRPAPAPQPPAGRSPASESPGALAGSASDRHPEAPALPADPAPLPLPLAQRPSAQQPPAQPQAAAMLPSSPPAPASADPSSSTQDRSPEPVPTPPQAPPAAPPIPSAVGSAEGSVVAGVRSSEAPSVVVPVSAASPVASVVGSAEVGSVGVPVPVAPPGSSAVGSDDQPVSGSMPALLPLAPLPATATQPRTAEALGVSGDSSVTVEFSVPRQTGKRGDPDLDDGFADDFGNARRATVLAGPLTPPEQPNRRMIRYDLLAGAALLLALLALVPLLLLRGDPEEMSSTPRVPAAGGAGPAGDVTVELAEPTDLTDEVQLSWKATRELDFAVVVAAEGEKTRVLLAERNHSITVDVEPGLKYCFMIQASDGDRVYESEPQPLRGATCQK